MAKSRTEPEASEAPVQHGLPLPDSRPAKAKPRRMSSGLQTMARIERMLDALDAGTCNRVLLWLRSQPLRNESDQTPGVMEAK